MQQQVQIANRCRQVRDDGPPALLERAAFELIVGLHTASFLLRATKLHHSQIAEHTAISTVF
jgi:hypothetical protein